MQLSKLQLSKQQVWVKFFFMNISNIKIQKVKQKRRRMNRVLQFFIYVKLIYSDKAKKILTIFRTKGNKSIDPFDFLINILIQKWQ